MLVLLGVRLDGTKELIALAEGLRESTESWADLLRDCRRRGMRDPELVVGDGAMGLWKALAEVFPSARHQRCWVHKARNATNALPKSAQPGATKAMQEIYNAEDRAHAEQAIDAFTKTYGAKSPKAVAKITDDREELLAFYDFPAEHWIHLRTTNPIESTFSTVKLRTKVTRGAGSPAAALAMVFKLVESAQARWRAISGAHLVARHERLIAKGAVRLDLDHYLEVLVRKPGTFPGSTALEQARSAGRFTPVHDAWWDQARMIHGERDRTRALIEVLLLGRHLPHEHVVAGLAAALRAGTMTADAVALEARKAAQAENEPTPETDRLASGNPSATVTSLHEWRLAHLPPDTRPLPSVTPYDQPLRRRRTSGGDQREGEAQRPCPASEA